MQIEKTVTVGQLAREIPSAVRFFEKVGLDYCCGGGKTLEEACHSSSLQVETVIASLETLADKDRLTPSSKNWNDVSLTDLVDHIVDTHHVTVQSEVPRLKQLIDKMCGAHGEKRPEFLRVQRLINHLQEDLNAHLQKEEVVLFPFVKELESALDQKGPLPHACFATVLSPITVMETEHETAGAVLAEIRDEIMDRSGCPTCQEFFRTFDAFEADLHQHIHLENNILFPKVIELEAAAG